MDPAENLGIDTYKPIIHQCCVCRQYKVRNGYTHLMPAFEKMIKGYYNVSHSYCGPCKDVAMAKLEQIIGDM